MHVLLHLRLHVTGDLALDGSRGITNELQSLSTSGSGVWMRPLLGVTESRYHLMIVQWFVWREFIVSGHFLMNNHPPHKKSPLLLTVIGSDLENEKFNQKLCSLHAMTTVSKLGISWMEKDTMLCRYVYGKYSEEKNRKGGKGKGKERAIQNRVNQNAARLIIKRFTWCLYNKGS